jgi:putative ABC transport system permease protein
MKTAIRSLLKRPALNVLVIFALALGLGANTAVFSVVNGVLLRPLPFDEAENLLIIRDTKIPQFPEFSVSAGNFIDRQTQSTAFEGMGAWSNVRFNLIEGSEPEALRGALVTASLLPTVRVTPMLGRVFLPEEDQEGSSNVVILSHRLWQRRFGSDPGVLGRSVNLNARSYTIIGVMPPDQAFPNSDIDLWAPIAFNAAAKANHGSHYLGSVARLKAGVSLEQATAELETIARRLEETYPGSNKGWGVKTIPLVESAVGSVRVPLLILLGAVAFVLLIACANVANLLLVRSNARYREMAIRVAIGASRWDLMKQVLAESLLLSMLGGAAGIVLANWGIDALLALAPQALPRAQEIRIDTNVFLFTLLVSAATGLLFGLVPALQSSRPHLNDALKEGGRGSPGSRRRQQIRYALVVAEVALSMILLVGAGLLIRSFVQLGNVNPGFDPRNALTVSLALPSQKYPGSDERRQFVDRALEEMSSIPGVLSVGVGHVTPFTGDYVVGVIIDGVPRPAPGEIVNTNYYAVSPGYFKAMGIPLKRGRIFQTSDTKDSTRVAVISETFANRFFPNENPIGKRVHLTQGPEAWREIVGIVGDVKQYGLDSETTLQAYEPFAQMPFSGLTFVVRTQAEPTSIASTIRERVRKLDKDQPVTTLRPMDEIVDDSLSQRRFSTVLLTVFAGIALLLASVGLYGVMAYLVTQRTSEIGLRMALGAPRIHVFKLVLGQGMLLTIAGLVLGLAGASVLTQLMTTMLYEVTAKDPLTFAGIPAVLAVVALLACYLPARRATKVDPIVALRYE